MWNDDRSKKNSQGLNQYMTHQKSGYDTEELKTCLETDDTDIDDEDVLQDLLHQNDVLQATMISDKMEAWSFIKSLLVYYIVSSELYVYRKFLLIQMIVWMIKNLLKELSL